MSDKEHRSGWSYVGEGIAWCLIILSIGGCNFLCSRDAKEPIVIIQHTNK